MDSLPVAKHSVGQPFRNFPKSRAPLPPEFQAIYAEHHRRNREGSSAASGLSQKMESWMHRKVAEDVRSGRSRSTLEIGAGTLNHLPYEPYALPYDIVEPESELYKSSINLNRIRNAHPDIKEVPAWARYDRIISIAAFEHICDLPEVVARCGLLLADGGQLRVAIPSEGTILWRLGWQLSTGVEFRLKYKLDYGVMMRHVHVNTAVEIEEILNHFFSSIASSVFGLSKSLSFYQFYKCALPNPGRCAKFLKACN